MNRIIPTLSLTSLAAASLLIAGCSEPPASPAVAKPVFVTTVAHTASTQTRTFTSVVRARVESDVAFRTGGKVVERLGGVPIRRLGVAGGDSLLGSTVDELREASN